MKLLLTSSMVSRSNSFNLKVTIHSKGADPIEVTKVLKELGWGYCSVDVQGLFQYLNRVHITMLSRY